MAYHDDLAALKMERLEIKHREVAEDLLHHDRERMEAEAAAQEALARGDTDSARWLVENAEHHEKSIANLSGELNELDAVLGAQQPQLSEAKQRWISERHDLVNPQTEQVATACHDYMVNRLGIAEDSEAYFSGMSVWVEPPEYQKPWGPNDVAEACGLTDAEYNRGVRELRKRKAAGEYPDR